jgi:V/A-type H+-transporting ATPase subunit F
MSRIVFLTPPDTAGGFRLAGVGERTATPEAAEGALLELARDPQTGVIVVDERLLNAIPEERLAGVERDRPGLVVVLPAPERVAEEADYALRLVRRAIGYQMRIRT